MRSGGGNQSIHLMRQPVTAWLGVMLMLSALLLLPGCSSQQSPDSEVLATVGTQKITRAEFNERLDDYLVRLGFPDNGETRKQTLSAMIDDLVLLAEARRSGLDREPDAKHQRSVIEKKLLLDQYASKVIH